MAAFLSAVGAVFKAPSRKEVEKGVEMKVRPRFEEAPDGKYRECESCANRYMKVDVHFGGFGEGETVMKNLDPEFAKKITIGGDLTYTGIKLAQVGRRLLCEECYETEKVRGRL